MQVDTQFNRTVWFAALSALPEPEFISSVSELVRDWTIKPLAVPQAGLGMLKLKDAALGEAFYLGEFPLVTAWLEVNSPDGRSSQGAAQVMGDNMELAEAHAVCDAILSGHLTGYQKIMAWVVQGMARREETQLERKRILAHTRVDFSLLDDVGEEVD